MADKHARTIADQGYEPYIYDQWTRNISEDTEFFHKRWYQESDFVEYQSRAKEHYHAGQWAEANAAAQIAQAAALRLMTPEGLL